MQEHNLFEYAVIRFVPKVEREEFMNIGVILFCKKEKYLEVKFMLDEARLNAFSKEIEMDLLENYLDSWQKICAGSKSSGTIGMLEMANRFRWLTANRSSIIQTSKVHPGFTKNAQETLDKLFDELVLC